MNQPTLELRQVSVAYRQGRDWSDAVRDVDLRIEPGQIYGLVGESGSGKTSLALAVLQQLPRNGAVSAGTILLGGRDVTAMTSAQRRDMWHRRIKLVPQNPLPSLNPAHPIGRQLTEVLAPNGGRAAVLGDAYELLESVGLADPQRVAASYPHQLSGGMQQRVMIAMALGVEPELLVLDEPTTNLDVTTEATILDLIKELIAERDTAVLFVSHSLGVVAQLCDRVAVLYAGDLVEDAAVNDLYRRPLHPYTQGLLDSVPRVGQHKSVLALRSIPGRIPPTTDLPAGCVFAPRCPLVIAACRGAHPPLEDAGDGRSSRCIRWREIRSGTVDPRQAPLDVEVREPSEQDVPTLEVAGLSKHFAVPRSLAEIVGRRPARKVRAVDGIDLSVRHGRTIGLVGESGSGKSTLARAIIGLNRADDGTMTLLELPLARDLAKRDRDLLRHLQMVFQSSDEALNPYHTVGHTLRRPFMRLGGTTQREADARVKTLLEAVKLPPSFTERQPEQLSGGEKQRVAIARAFASDPDLLLFDESVSGLDVSVQAAILNLLVELQSDSGTAFVFISHDLAVVSYLADEIAVIYLGHLMEVGPTHDVLEPPYHPYTEALLSAIPLIDRRARQERIRLEGDVPSPVNVPSGCRFHTRCPRSLGAICATQEPPWQQDERGNKIYCHIPLEDLAAMQSRVFSFPREDDSDEVRP